jgi:hypothetical protein
MKRFLLIFGIFIILIITGYAAYANLYTKSTTPSTQTHTDESTPTATAPVQAPVTHIATPKPVKALYMSSWVAASPKPLEHVLKLLDTTEANAVVLDIKDATGKVSFLVDDSVVTVTGSPENRIKNIKEFLEKLHAKNIYVIGRISTFQDPYLAKTKPAWALAKKSDGSVWKDKKGLAFLDPTVPEVTDYLIALGRASYALGFDEINYDYIRYPSDGNIKDINYRLAPGKTRADNIEMFSKKLNEGLKKDAGLVTSADLFGLTTTETTDMGIGQVFERMLPYFDYIAPMIYPSHYAKGEYGIDNPSKKPYETITKALAGAKKKIDAMNRPVSATSTATGTAVAPQKTVSLSQIRPWIQDFELAHVPYTADMIKLEMKAVYDSGITSWMMWDPSNRYTEGAYQLD